MRVLRRALREARSDIRALGIHGGGWEGTSAHAAEGLGVVVETGSWPGTGIFSLIQMRGRHRDDEDGRTFNVASA